jgi:hypothetical protein
MYKDQPVLLIGIETDPQNGTKYKLTEQGEAILSSLSDKVICVVAIAGPQRTGKSFLANTIMNRLDGFQIGNSTLPCTKGIWIWGSPIIIGDQALVLIDTEGLHSIFRDQQVDSVILGISLLLSSVFVYNK